MYTEDSLEAKCKHFDLCMLVQGISSTALKRVCTKLGIFKWPYPRHQERVRNDEAGGRSFENEADSNTTANASQHPLLQRNFNSLCCLPDSTTSDPAEEVLYTISAPPTSLTLKQQPFPSPPPEGMGYSAAYWESMTCMVIAPKLTLHSQRKHNDGSDFDNARNARKQDLDVDSSIASSTFSSISVQTNVDGSMIHCWTN